MKFDNRRVVAVGIVLPLALLLIASPASALPSPGKSAEVHCVLNIVDQTVEGKYVLGGEECFNTESEADAASAAASLNSTLDLVGGSVALAGSLNLARHYTGLSYTGSSVLVTGSVLCGGGTINWTGTSWNNNFESAISYCGGPPVTHFDYSTCTGTSKGVTGYSSSLTPINNLTSCTKYGY